MRTAASGWLHFFGTWGKRHGVDTPPGSQGVQPQIAQPRRGGAWGAPPPRASNGVEPRKCHDGTRSVTPRVHTGASHRHRAWALYHRHKRNLRADRAPRGVHPRLRAIRPVATTSDPSPRRRRMGARPRRRPWAQRLECRTVQRARGSHGGTPSGVRPYSWPVTKRPVRDQTLVITSVQRRGARANEFMPGGGAAPTHSRSPVERCADATMPLGPPPPRWATGNAAARRRAPAEESG